MPGQRITSATIRNLCHASWDRLRGGVGNPSERVWLWFLNLWRQVEASAGLALNNPSQTGWHEFYGHLGPDGPRWPAGEEPVSNQANPMQAWIFGVGNTPGEIDRTSCIPLGSFDECGNSTVPTFLEGGAAPQTKQDLWILGIQQRGGYDPDTGVQNARLLNAAVSYFGILFGFSDLHHKCFGGYVPQPESLGFCGDIDPGPETEDFQIFYSRLNGGAPKEYEGTCPPIEGQPRPKHIRFRIETPRSYYVLLNDGTLDILSKKEFIEGPYRSGGRYTKLDGQQLERMMNAWISEFRGSLAERAASDWDWSETGFKFQSLMTSQYFGAPNLAVLDGDTLDLVLPQFEAEPAGPAEGPWVIPAGTQLGGEHAYRNGFVLGGFWAVGRKLKRAVTIQMRDGNRLLDEFVLNPIGEDGGLQTSVEELKFYRDGESPGALRFVLKTAAEFTEGPSEDPDNPILHIEANEILKYQVELDDLFLLLRLFSADGFEGKTGEESSSPVDFFKSYMATGCIVSGALSTAGLFTNDNQFYETARKLTRKCTRLVTRESLLGYEVTGGKSILYFSRLTRGLDQFEGIAPPRTAPNEIHPGVRYVVRSGTVTYHGNTYGAVLGDGGYSFTGVAGVASWTGSGELREYEGIVPEGPSVKKRGWTNQWQMWTKGKAYSNSEANPMKPSLFADAMKYHDRCHFFSEDINRNRLRNLWRRMLFRQEPVIWAEAVDAMRYAEGSNARADGAFQASCRVYWPVPEAESVISYADPGGGVEIVKVTLNQRIHHCEGFAPGFVSQDLDLWDRAALQAEPYRSEENGIREYLLHMRLGPENFNCTKNKPGDGAAGNRAWETYDNLWGSCYPDFFWLKLPDAPYEDGNETQDKGIDANHLMDLLLEHEIYIRAMAPGFMDERTSKAVCNDNTDVMDYTPENLCLDAFGKRWFTSLPDALRPDRPQGFTPLVNCDMLAAIYNQYPRAYNKLDKARLMKGFVALWACGKSGQTVEPLAADWPGTSDSECGSPTKRAAFFGKGSPGVSENSCGSRDGIDPGDGAAGWDQVAGVVGASASYGILPDIRPGGVNCLDGNWQFAGFKSSVEWDFKWLGAFGILHPDVIPLVQDQMYALAIYDESTVVAKLHPVTTREEAENLSAGAEAGLNKLWDEATQTGYRFAGPGDAEYIPPVTVHECRVMPFKGSLEVSAPGGADLATGVTFTSSNDFGVVQATGGGGVKSASYTLSGAAVPWIVVPLVEDNT